MTRPMKRTMRPQIRTINFRSVLAGFLILLLSSCASTSVPSRSTVHREPLKKAPPVAEQELRSAETSARSGDNKNALLKIRRIVKVYPGTMVADSAYLLAGNVHYKLEQYGQALSNYKVVSHDISDGPLANDAHLQSARTLIRLNRVAEAETEIKPVTEPLPPEKKQELNSLRFEILSSQKKNLEALAVLVESANSSINATEKERYREQAQEFMESHLTDDELKSVASDSKYDFLQVAAKYRAGLLAAEQHDYDKARSLLGDVVRLAPGTDLADRASGLVRQIDSRNRVDAHTIGVVLPLSGKQSAIGYKALRGIQLGLGIYGKKSSNLKLAVVDSEGNPDSARRAVERLVQEDGAMAIIGGVLSKTASSEASKAQELGIPTILLSQKAGVTQAGDAIFRNALTSQMQVRSLVEIAMGKLGHKRFAIMFPNDAYGTEYTNLFWDEVRARGGEIVGAQPYDPKETDFGVYVQRLVGNFYLEDRAEEYKYRMHQYAEKNPKKSARGGGPAIEDILPPIIDFDALFVPDSARAIGQIAPMLRSKNITKMRLLGTNIWNSQNMVTRGGKYVEGAIFVDSVLAGDPSFTRTPFYEEFRATFGEEPGLTEVQAYDSALILRQLISSGGDSTRLELQHHLASLKNFPGAIGPLSATADREILRPMTALTIQDSQIVPLGSAAANN
jgi:branched-chain amino acid transport system substrate-binding protein